MIGSLYTVVLDAPDIARLSAFYRGLADWTEVDNRQTWIALQTPDGWRIGLQEAPDHRPPRWPGQELPQQAHLDLRVPNLDAGLQRVLDLGGTLLSKQESCYTVADPAGHPVDLCRNPDDPNTTLMGVMFDCPDTTQLRGFYSALLGKPVTFEAEGAAMIGEDGNRPLLFQQVADYAAPRWPDPAHPQQLHIDVLVDDFDPAEAAVLDLGATATGHSGANFRVYTDPAGKPFCLVIA